MSFLDDILPWIRDLGVPISIAAATGAYIYRTRVEQRRMANRVLYYLLEFRYRFRMMHFKPKGFGKEIMDSYLNVWKKYGLNLESTDLEIIQHLEVLMDQMVSNLLILKASIPEGFADGFRDALNELSERDPVTAFRINGSEDVNILIEEIEDYSERARQVFPDDDPTQTIIDALKDELHVNKLQEPFDDLDATIRSLAVRCGWKTRFRVWKMLRKRELKIPSSIRKDLDKHMEEIVPQIIEVMQSFASKEENKELLEATTAESKT